jgi:thiamine biosynthesis lipoprotein
VELELRRVQQIMGMPISLALRRGEEPLADEVFGWLRWVDATFSTYKSDSEISRLVRGELRPHHTHPLVREVLGQAAALAAPTKGYFDIHARGRLDPSGYVKGWAVQMASDLLLARGSYDHCINAGGDIRAHGRNAEGRPWRIAVQDPQDPAEIRWIIETEDLAVATSGTYARGGHVIDPHTGQAALALSSVTVVGQDLALADAYATAALAMGTDARHWLSVLEGYDAALIDAGGGTWSSIGWPCEDE